MEAEKYREKIVNVEVMQFTGWQTFSDIFKWSGGKVFYVPAGEEHPLRYDNERAGMNQIVVHSAPAFLVVYTNDDDEVRADKGEYIIKDMTHGFVFPVMQDTFVVAYEKRSVLEA